MKYHLLLISGLSLFAGGSICAGERSESQGSPLSFEASYIGDGLANFSGGLKKGATYLGLANLGLFFDTQKAGLWKGGQFCIVGANTHGGTPSESLIGDFQIASNIEAGDLTYIHELWYRQSFGKLSTILGVQDLNAQFASSENAGLFLNSSFGIHSTISNNIPSPIFPLTALGWQFQYDFSEKVSGKVAIFDGLPEGFKHHTYNISWKLDPNEGYLLVSEFSLADLASAKLPGLYKLGVYYHNHYGLSNIFDAEERQDHQNYGFYLVADQSLYKGIDGRSLSVFAQASLSPQSKNTNSSYLGMGLNYSGLLQGRTEDVLGLAVARAGFKNSVYPNETTMELTYKAQLTDHVYIQPDIQYVIRPSGTDEKLENALVGALRFGLDF
ncbi:MAG: carbohydrate porin [Bacteroidales bacterium]|nr:carbohydrate porin [Bacteroidales bacterium]